MSVLQLLGYRTSVSIDAKWLSACKASNDKTACNNLENPIYIMDLKYNITRNYVATHTTHYTFGQYSVSVKHKIKNQIPV